MKFIILLLTSLYLISANAQHPVADSISLLKLNQSIDDQVVQQQVVSLDTLYATDFVFSHGTGKIENKASWLKTVASTKYLLRLHDSVTVEMHPVLGILRGKLTVHRVDLTKTERYHLKYIRIYSLRNNSWQLISHVTTHEIHE